MRLLKQTTSSTKTQAHAVRKQHDQSRRDNHSQRPTRYGNGARDNECKDRWNRTNGHAKKCTLHSTSRHGVGKITPRNTNTSPTSHEHVFFRNSHKRVIGLT